MNKSKKSVNFGLDIELDILEKFKELAKKDDRTRKSLLAKILKEYVLLNAKGEVK